MDAYNELVNKIKKLDAKITNNETSISKLTSTISILSRKSDLQNEVTRLKGEISDISGVVTEVNARLNKVLLPKETKYYLGEDELLSLRNKIRQMNALLVRMQNLEKIIVQSLSRLDQRITDIPSTV